MKLRGRGFVLTRRRGIVLARRRGIVLVRRRGIVLARRRGIVLARERGFILVIVLGVLALLALLGTQVTGTARLEDRQASGLRAAATAHALAEGALHHTIFNLLTGRVSADGVARKLDMGGGTTALVTVTSEATRINPNTAPVDLLAALLRVVGQSGPQARALAAAIVAWRGDGIAQEAGPELLQPYRAASRAFGPSARDFHSLDELSLVIGMTPALQAAVTPHLSLYAMGALVPSDPVVAKALVLDGIDAASIGATISLDLAVVRIVVSLRTAPGAGGAAAGMTAVVRLESGNPQNAAEILSWNDHTPAP